MGYEHVTSLNQLLRRRKIGLDKLEQMAEIIKDDIYTRDKQDEEILEINNKIKELEQQIVKVIEE